MTEVICKNCGTRFVGNFCNNCGEKVYTEHDKSMRHFFGESLHFFLHLDNKFFKTLALIFRRPGQLSQQYCNGIRNKFYQPVSLFFIGVILYLLFPFFQGLNMSFSMSIITFKNSWMGFLTHLATWKASASHISLQQLAEKYDHSSPAFAKVLVLVILPLTALVLKVVFPKKRKYFFDYLILSTEWNSLLLYFFFLFLPLVLRALVAVLHFFKIPVGALGDEILFPVYTGFIIFWSINAFARFFEISFMRALWKAFLFLFFQLFVILIYRVLLFLAVLFFI